MGTISAFFSIVDKNISHLNIRHFSLHFGPLIPLRPHPRILFPISISGLPPPVLIVMLNRAVRAARHRQTFVAPATSTPRHIRSSRSSNPSLRPIASSSTRRNTSWAAATESAHAILEPTPSPSSSMAASSSSSSSSASSTSGPSLRSFEYDPLGAITSELGNLKESLFRMLGSSHPSLDTVAKYYFGTEGKHLRPLLVLLMSQATNGLASGKGGGWELMSKEAEIHARGGRGGIDDSLTSSIGILNDWNPEIMGEENGEMLFAKPFKLQTDQQSSLDLNLNLNSNLNSSASPSSSPLFTQGLKTRSPDQVSPFEKPLSTATPSSPTSPSILPTQRRLASITEMIHVASLLHDDVIDASDLRRGKPSAPSTFGNKLSILSGDFLLGRASVALARLGSREVVELLATVIANLVEGEVMQLKATAEPEREPTKKGFEDYMRKTYLKTASLMAKSARAAVILGGCGLGNGQGAWVKDVAYGYGRNLGIAFQLVDDMLDYSNSAQLGKPGSGADLRLGLATAPALFAWEEHPSLGPLILRKFSRPGDVEVARELVGRSRGMERTAELAKSFADEARRLIETLPESPARSALIDLTIKVVDRVK